MFVCLILILLSFFNFFFLVLNINNWCGPFFKNNMAAVNFSSFESTILKDRLNMAHKNYKCMCFKLLIECICVHSMWGRGGGWRGADHLPVWQVSVYWTEHVQRTIPVYINLRRHIDAHSHYKFKHMHIWPSIHLKTHAQKGNVHMKKIGHQSFVVRKPSRWFHPTWLHMLS